MKLLHPNPGTTVPDADVEWIVRLALEARRRVKEQQRRVFKSEFRNTHFSYTLGLEGVETFVATPELRSDQAIETDPLPPGQVWAISPGSAQNGAGLYRIEVSHQPGSGMRILNQPAPPAFRESVKVGEQVLFAQARTLVGDRDPRAQEFTLQLRAIDADKSGAGLGVPILTALCGSLLGRNSRGGTIVVGSASLGGSIEMVTNPVQLAELAIEKQAQTLLMPVSARRQLNARQSSDRLRRRKRHPTASQADAPIPVARVGPSEDAPFPDVIGAAQESASLISHTCCFPHASPSPHASLLNNDIGSTCWIYRIIWSGRRDSNPRPRPWQGSSPGLRLLTSFFRRLQKPR